MKDNELIEILKEFDEKRVEQLNDNARKMFYAIMELADSRDKYKSLYKNEKDHTDTLKRIIHNVSENIYNLIDECNSIIGNKESSIVSKNQLMIMQREELTKILDLLKENK